MRKARVCGFAAVAFLAAGIAGRAADAPAGLVMAVSGTTDPPFAPMAEIPANLAIKLQGDARLTFLQYARCKLVTVAGGVLTITLSGYSTDGRVEGEEDGPCPQTYSLTPAGPGAGAPTTAAVVMRGAGGTPHWPVNAQLLLAGPGAADFDAAAVHAEDQPDSAGTALAIAGGKLSAAPGALPLLPNRRYVLRLTGVGRAASSDIVFVTSAAREPPPLVILRFE